MPLQKYLLIPHHVHILAWTIIDDRLAVTMGQSGLFEQGLGIYQGIGIGETRYVFHGCQGEVEYRGMTMILICNYS